MGELERATRRVLKEVLPPAVTRLARRLVTPRHARPHDGLLPAPTAVAVLPPDPVRAIDNLADLDAALALAEAAFAVSDDEGRKVLDGFRYVVGEPLSADPYSAAYREAQMRVYAGVSGRDSYDASINERSRFDVEKARYQPFPYETRSAETVGTYLIKQGLIIRHLAVAPGSRIVEFGPGWGSLTLHLAQMGHEVTGVEIEPSFAGLIRDRAARLGVGVRIVEQDMLTFEPAGRYDAAIFFESLHHCADHLRMLQRLDDIVAPGGMVLFATEPIADSAQPWGVRLDGLSVWCMRRFGWLELGFDSSYFLRTLLLFGWLPQRHQVASVQGADVVVARRAEGVYEPHRIAMPPDEERTWLAVQPGGRVAGRHSTLSCARRPVPASVEFALGNPGAVPALVTLRAGESRRAVQLASGAEAQRVVLPVAGWDGQIGVAAATALPHGDADTGEPQVVLHQVRLIS